MNVSYSCPTCNRTVRSNVASGASTIGCSACQNERPLPAVFSSNTELNACLICSGSDLYLRKDFSQRLGVGIVVLGFGISTVTWYFYMIYLTYAVLFTAALIDAILFMIVPNMLQCYRCQAEYRDVPGLAEHSPFNLETHERYRQQAARLPQNVASSSRT